MEAPSMNLLTSPIWKEGGKRWRLPCHKMAFGNFMENLNWRVPSTRESWLLACHSV